MSRRPTPKKGWLAHYSGLIGTWTRKAGNPHDVEDAIQDAAVSMLEIDGSALRDHDRYFHRIAINRSINIYRFGVLRQSESLDELSDNEHPVTPSAQDLYEAEQMACTILSALTELPQACQIAFQLRQAEGFSNAEIAQKMGVSRNMVERYMMRTLRHLQDQLHKNG